MMSEREQVVRWGILGCGDVTEIKSGPALQQTNRSTLCSVMRRDKDKAADYASRHNVPRWTDDADSLINDAELTAIYVATPPDTHMTYAIRALQAGKDVLVEKPMALDPGQCHAMEVAAKETGRKLSVAYYRRALPRFETFRRIAADGTIGTLRMIEVRQFVPHANVPDNSWKVDATINGGGLFVDMQSHTLDWLAYLFGTPVSAAGLKKSQGNNCAAENLVSYIMDFGDFPVIGLCAYSTMKEEECVILYGDKGSARMSFFQHSPIILTLEGSKQQQEIADPPHVHQPFIERVISHFLDDAPNPCSPAEGRLVAELTKTIFTGLSTPCLPA